MTSRIQTSNPVVVSGVGPVPAPGMIIGEAPGRKEIEDGRPFVGRSGELLDSALERAGLLREQLYVTNVYKGDVGTGNRNPTREEILDHSELLDEELSAVNPSAILLLGRVATNSFLPYGGGMAELVGRPLVVRGYTIIPCWHPAYILRNYSRLGDFQRIIDDFAVYVR